jgi:7-cyano-7-deazaguanine synthase
MSNSNALVLFSGGQDSATCLIWALDRFEHVETVGFDYRQRHHVELEVRQTFISNLREAFPEWSRKLGDDTMVDIGGLADLGETAMTDNVAIQMQENGLPNTFVPGRNILFFTYAAALAYRRNCKHIIGGMCETDYSGYPDCRDDTLKALQVALNIGMESRFVVHTPLMWIDKAATWKLADEFGGRVLLDLITEYTHTCYLGDRTKRNEWGYGCGECPACELREKGWNEYSV